MTNTLPVISNDAEWTISSTLDGEPITFSTAWTIWFNIVRRRSDSWEDSLLTRTIENGQASDGISIEDGAIVISLTAEETKDIPAGATLFAYCKGRGPDGKHYPLLVGQPVEFQPSQPNKDRLYGS